MDTATQTPDTATKKKRLYKCVLAANRNPVVAVAKKASKVKPLDKVMGESEFHEDMADMAKLYNDKLARIRRKMKYRIKVYNRDFCKVAPAFVGYYRKDLAKQIAILERIEKGEIVEID